MLHVRWIMVTDNTRLLMPDRCVGILGYTGYTMYSLKCFIEAYCMKNAYKLVTVKFPPSPV